MTPIKPKKGSWIVRITATVTKEIVCHNCTEEQARATPYEFCESEDEIDQSDYTVTSVKENK